MWRNFVQSQTRDVFARLYLENGHPYDNVTGSARIHSPSTIKCNAQIRCRSESQGCGARVGGMPKNKMRFFEKKTIFPKEYMTTSIHVLCSNFTEIVRREVGETMRCCGDKKFTKCVFQRHLYHPRAPGWSYMSPCNVRPGADLPELFSKSDFARSQYLPSAYTKSTVLAVQITSLLSLVVDIRLSPTMNLPLKNYALHAVHQLFLS